MEPTSLQKYQIIKAVLTEIKRIVAEKNAAGYDVVMSSKRSILREVAAQSGLSFRLKA